MVPSPEVKQDATAASSKPDVQIKAVDMFEDLQQEVIELAHEAMVRFTVEKDIAMHIKRTMDERKGQTWHCIVGRNFGSFVTHETKHFIYFYLTFDQNAPSPGYEAPPIRRAVLLFKTQ